MTVPQQLPQQAVTLRLRLTVLQQLPQQAVIVPQLLPQQVVILPQQLPQQAPKTRNRLREKKRKRKEHGHAENVTMRNLSVSVRRVWPFARILVKTAAKWSVEVEI